MSRNVQQKTQKSLSRRQTNRDTSDQSLPTVSIVIPVYNAARFLHETVASVKKQTFTDWELILVDDCSTDDSLKIVEQYAAQDKRILVIKNDVNSGAAFTRNRGIKIAQGTYLAFLDADDLWHVKKLEKQVAFMREKGCAFSFTGYEFADATGKPNGKRVYVPKTITYKQALRNTTISTITVMFDLSQLQKRDIYMPLVYSEDTATWWRLLRTKVARAYGINEVLSVYRRTRQSLSANKLQAVKQVWVLYRKVENLSLVCALYNFLGYATNALKRRV